MSLFSNSRTNPFSEHPPQDPLQERLKMMTRRQLLGKVGTGLGAAALAQLWPGQANALSSGAFASPGLAEAPGQGAALSALHHAPKAKRVIQLFMSGAPSQIDMWDHKPKLAELFDQELPDSVRNGQRITTMTSGQSRFPVAPSIYSFERAGQSGCLVSELLPHTKKIVDDICVVRSVFTEAINHDPAITFTQTGHQIPGRPSMGSWMSYGLGSLNQDLPTYVVLTASWTGRREAQALFSRMWGSGFLPSVHQGVALRSKGDPVLYLTNPEGMDPSTRRRMLDSLAELNQEQYEREADPETLARIAQYEMAFRMQSSVPDLMDLSSEPEEIFELYGPDSRKPGTFAASCLLARRLVERDVRFVQIYHRGWDQHFNLPTDLPNNCRDIDQAAMALITDMKRSGLLEDTLVVWGGEFGRTTYCQGTLTKTNYGRDHHPRCFTMWMAGAGIQPGLSYGATDDFSYNITENPVHVHDINATILHQLGIDHKKLTYRFQGRDFRLTDVHGNVVHDILT